jgi:hypothetical protein
MLGFGDLQTDRAQAGLIDPSVPIEKYRQLGEQA